MQILLVDGASDTEPVIQGETQRFSGLLAAAAVRATTQIIPGGHSWQLVQGSLPMMERFLDSGW